MQTAVGSDSSGFPGRNSLLQACLEWSSSMSNGAAAWCLGLSWLTVAAADFASGPLVSLSSIYLLPLCFTTWCFGRSAGFATGLLATLHTMLANGFGDGLSAQQTSIPHSVAAWNAFMRIFGVAFIIMLVAALRRTFDQERYKAGIDPLTMISNRRAFQVESDRLSASSARNGDKLLCGLIDLDDFKMINDRWGHEYGDATLQCLSAALAGIVRPHDLTARLGGDEFAFCLKLENEASALGRAEEVHSAISRHLAAMDHPSTCSLGAFVSIDVRHGMKLADAALYEAKSRGKGSWHLADGRIYRFSDRVAVDTMH